jgi:hypothetical protein
VADLVVGVLLAELLPATLNIEIAAGYIRVVAGRKEEQEHYKQRVQPRTGPAGKAAEPVFWFGVPRSSDREPNEA